MVRTHPYAWASIMISYPVLSVCPQGVVYRAFLFRRYRPLFTSNWPVILMSALAFAYVHIVFRNSLAVGFTLLGGFLFALRYRQSGSLLVSCLEHALYGCLLFTVGLGNFFIYGATPAADLHVVKSAATDTAPRRTNSIVYRTHGATGFVVMPTPKTYLMSSAASEGTSRNCGGASAERVCN